MTRNVSDAGLKFIEKWEEFVGYVYDDKVPKRRINGVLRYPEWDGGAVHGTLTVGIGHTDAAGWPKIKLGLKMTHEEALETLNEDLRSCRSDVEKYVKVVLNQHQYDAVVSFTFNCGPGNMRKLVVGLNKGDYASMPRRLMQYVTSKGERMQGLVNRRAGEVRLWNTPVDNDERDAMPVPKGDRNEAPKTMVTSKTGLSSIGIGTAGVGMSLSTLSDNASTVAGIKSSADDLGIMDYLGEAMHSPIFWVGVIVLLLGAFVYWDRHRKLETEQI